MPVLGGDKGANSKKDDDAPLLPLTTPPAKKEARTARTPVLKPLLPSLVAAPGSGPGAGAGSAALPRAFSRPVACCLLLLFALFFVHRFGKATLRHLEPEALRETFEAAGDIGGVALYAAAFCVGELLHVPGIVFVIAGVLVWGCATG